MDDYNNPIDPKIAERAKARTALIGTANKLRECLSELNWHGDAIGADNILATQMDGCAWGEVHDGWKILMRVLFPDDGIEGRAEQIMSAMFDGAEDIESAAQYVADQNAPMANYSTDDVRAELARYRAYKVALANGALNVDRIIGPALKGETTTDHARQADMYLDEQIAECLAALAYRGEPEITATDSVGS